MFTIQLSTRARRDLQAVHAWYGQGGVIAKRRVQHIIKALEDLAGAPFRWPVDDLDSRFRMRIVEKHRIRYRVSMEDRVVEVVRIRGPWQNLP
ncbi:type II toxin-antitoxin system RelE/ParE family toxin [Aerophototrophica crusticola]|uniref:Type II toxin-antitoxin system RelE/ParE family toxin n=1 Tax=Aerophototrophica crusticola TaxID=1709002 RepID=A0A858R453_9PROT|nr:type II toxin-antitoxin system RelE/ParE family toxin [Rhodospirillaceae bacterium B3]